MSATGNHRPANQSCQVDDIDWEMLWAPYDADTYALVLREIRPADVVIDIGAGDFRLVTQMAGIAHTVYGVEIHSGLMPPAHQTPANVVAINADARQWPFPDDITTAVLLMRHCSHFSTYYQKLKTTGCKKLITNARWRMGVEVIDLRQPAIEYRHCPMGWYACQCGQVGFKPGPVELYSWADDQHTYEVANCPNCMKTKKANQHYEIVKEDRRSELSTMKQWVNQ
ncbi:MAG: rRNA adenine methyltransferase [Chloroflexi bacterium]|nr:rRNA adenine methyltransferase [Chloroflexota bacterium]